MVPTLLARVDGLPEVLLDREQVWPANGGAVRRRRSLSAAQRGRVERQTAVVHAAVLPRGARELIGSDACSPFADAEAERLEISRELAQAGLR